ncbi:calcium-binding protein [Paractinoplanes brasiliensis]|uniref:calcium-binding protein n=1 Tax=Paractinoplanes brasiliensis TaxID=52695 RepID=UPI001EF347EF|nr:calcium-binding protein [Actinoplanes brasiliensis]
MGTARIHSLEPQPGGSLSSAAGEVPEAVLYSARVSSLSDTELDALAGEPVVDCYDENERLSGLFAMIEDNLAVPFGTDVLGVPVVVRKVDMRSSGIVPNCHRGRLRQAIGILDLPLPDPVPDGAQWIEAYRWWAGAQ